MAHEHLIFWNHLGWRSHVQCCYSYLGSEKIQLNNKVEGLFLTVTDKNIWHMW